MISQRHPLNQENLPIFREICVELRDAINRLKTNFRFFIRFVAQNFIINGQCYAASAIEHNFSIHLLKVFEKHLKITETNNITHLHGQHLVA